ncbi:MAG TPA: tripartite tricarboxylate transporter substrate-binding protein, partial [Bordetella sp.]|nr:tripartite tricarboxylate transporter substrate-binding protein [Bordetella sp.]
MSLSRLSRLARLACRTAGVALVAAASTAHATYPDRPVTLVVPFPTGGNSDIVARQIGERMGQALGQPVIVENRTGAGGLVGNQAVARARP